MNMVWFQIRIDVLDKNDSPPSFSETPTEFSVSEDLPVGHVVTTVKVTDPDSPTRITFSLVAGDVEKFHLDADTGVLSLIDLLDRETKSKHKLIVQASDGIQKTEATFTITVSQLKNIVDVVTQPERAAVEESTLQRWEYGKYKSLIRELR